MPIKPYLVLDGGMDCEKTGGPTKQVQRRGRTKSDRAVRNARGYPCAGEGVCCGA